MCKLALVLLVAIAVVPASAQKKVVCYFENWATYRPGDGKFDAANVNPSLCTHAIYAFIGVKADGTVKILDPWIDVDSNGFKNFNKLKLNNTKLKTLVAAGGASQSTADFSLAVRTAATRGKLVTNLFNFVKQNGFDGLDLDWEFPAASGGVAADKANFLLLVTELRAKFGPAGLLLSAAVGSDFSLVTTAYDVPKLAAQLDFINLMTYDFHGTWDQVTGINSPLYAANTDTNKNINTNATVQLWLKQGAPAAKLVLGMGLYGRSFTLKSSTSAGLGAPVTGAGVKGTYTQEAGMLGYNEICEMQQAGGWTVTFQQQQKVPFASKGTQWVGYDNVESVRIKSEYVKQFGLGGGMVWAIGLDDFRGKCGAGKYPLLSKIKETLG